MALSNFGRSPPNEPMNPYALVRNLAAGAFFVAVLALLTSRLLSHLHVLGSEDDAARWGMIDFRDVIYFPTRAVLEGVNPYDSVPTDDPSRYRARYPVGNVFPVYSPLLMALDAPLQLLPYRAAMGVYGLFNLALLLGVAWFTLKIAKWNGGLAATLFLASLMLLGRPGQSNFYYGQLALPMVLCALVATHYSAAQPSLAALALALSTIKPTFGAPLLILTFCQGRWRAALGGAALGGSIAVLGFAFVFATCSSGSSALETFRDNLNHTESDPGFDPQKTGLRLDAGAVAERLSPAPYRPAMKLAIPLSILAISGAVLWLLSHDRFAPVQWTALPLIMVTTLLCVFHAAYDGLLLVAPIVSLLSSTRILGTSARQKAIRWSVAALLLVPAVNLFSSRQFLKALTPFLGGIISTADDGWLWALASILNGLVLLAAWAILVASALYLAVTDGGKTTTPQSTAA
jgi:hypothetical protein